MRALGSEISFTSFIQNIKSCVLNLALLICLRESVMSMVQRIGRSLLLRHSQWPVAPTSTRNAAGAVNCFHASRIARWGESKSTTTRKTSTTSTETAATTTKQTKNWADPDSRQYKFWNREDDAKAAGKYSFLIEMSPESILKEARIISLSDPNDPANAALHGAAAASSSSAAPAPASSLPTLPLGASLVGIGTTVDAFDAQCRPNVLFVSPSCPHAATVLPQVLRQFQDTVEWVHVRSAGIDFVESDDLVELCRTDSSRRGGSGGVVVTNAKGQFSSSLAEYALMACSYFAKDIPRLMRQQQAARWEKYNVEEL
jgi:hypothetical protein